MKKTYEQNIEIINELYESDFGKKHKGNTFFKYIIDSIYTDPDLFDNDLKKRADKLTEKYNIKFSPDGICGWKLLFDLYDGNESNDWIKKYEIIRGSELGTLYWPCIKNNGITINVERNNRFGDRIDLTLFDIKSFIEKKTTVMKFTNSDTISFFDNFRKKGGFEAFINEFNLSMFTNNNYEIYDLSEEEYTNNYIDYIKCKEFSNNWSNRCNAKTKKDKLQTYIENLLSIIETNNKSQ